ncbi:MAG TPA: ATP-binding protein, partial [Stellaceae bacterium]|nr:ATP-binding protein [Stellaceae bacterium]
QRAGEIIRRLRAFVATGEVRRQAERIAGVVDDAVALALVGTAQRLLKPEIVVGQDLPAVLIDPVQIQQVLVNLIRNAVDAMEISKRHHLAIAARVVDGGMVEVSVADSGLGLAEEVASRLFQPFTTTKVGGMGVGLSICRTIVQAHGGSIWTEANPEGGTIFRFTIPIAPAAPAAKAVTS